jgi:hypothetical protein
MPTRLPALPALVAARALEADATAAARRALDEVRHLLAGYDLVRDLLDGLPGHVRNAGTAALARRLRAADERARACQDRLEEASVFRAAVRSLDSPTAPVDVPAGLWEMLSPYLDDAMAPVLQGISRRVGSGCTADDVSHLFRPAVTA